MKNSKILFSLIIVLFSIIGCTNNNFVNKKEKILSLVSSKNRLVFKKENNYEGFLDFYLAI